MDKMQFENGMKMAEWIEQLADKSELSLESVQLLVALSGNIKNIVLAAVACTLVHNDRADDQELIPPEIVKMFAAPLTSRLNKFIKEVKEVRDVGEAGSAEKLNGFYRWALVNAVCQTEDICGVPRTNGTKAGTWVD